MIAGMRRSISRNKGFSFHFLCSYLRSFGKANLYMILITNWLSAWSGKPDTPLSAYSGYWISKAAYPNYCARRHGKKYLSAKIIRCLYQESRWFDPWRQCKASMLINHQRIIQLPPDTMTPKLFITVYATSWSAGLSKRQAVMRLKIAWLGGGCHCSGQPWIVKGEMKFRSLKSLIQRCSCDHYDKKVSG